MQANAFKRAAALVAPVKDVKSHLRVLPRKTLTATYVHAAISLAVAAGTLMTTLSPYVAGTQLNEELKAEAYRDLGPVFEHSFVLAKALKVKLPGSGKKVKLVGETTTESLLHIHRLSNDLLSLVRVLTDGGGLTEKLDMDESTVAQAQAKLTELLNEVYAFTYALLKIAPAEVLADHFSYLSSIWGPEFFAPKPPAVKADTAEPVA
jgi:hypothetical protein